ncbi:MAG: DUF6519 domain-containing protein, partial [Gemmatimonadaceae bacterium]
MHGDFSRLTFDPSLHYSRVLVQQGRAFVDAEPNEQNAILLHLMRGLARDIIGAHGIPTPIASGGGFRIEPPAAGAARDFSIQAGRYYVDGIPCENEELTSYFTQPDYFPDPADNPLPVGAFLLFLDVWERHITYFDRALLRETSLGGPDGASRAKVVWQVKAVEDPTGILSATPLPDEIAMLVEKRAPDERPLLRARVKPGEASTTPCITPPDGGYRGRENQLYRVEVHTGGVAAPPGVIGSAAAGIATFKWSRDNGSIVFPVTQVTANEVTVEHLGLDATRTLIPGDWVELLDNVAVLHRRPGVLARVLEVSESRRVTLVPAPGQTLVGATAADRNPFLRRWDHRGASPVAGALMLSESASPNAGWLDLEDGVQVQFQPRAPNQQYVTGDFWTIVARAETGNIEWPREVGAPGTPAAR